MDFNDEGGFVENAYQSGVGYQVLGAVTGSTFDSFIRGDGTGNGATLSALDTTAMDGFALNPQRGTDAAGDAGDGLDATHICAGGTAGAPVVLPPITVHPQTDGINHSRVVSVAIYCRLTPECRGTATLMLGGKRQGVGHAGFALRGNKTSHLPIRVAPQVVKLIRRTTASRRRWWRWSPARLSPRRSPSRSSSSRGRSGAPAIASSTARPAARALRSAARAGLGI